MPRRPRHHVTASFFHVTNRGIRKAALFTRPRDYRAFLAVLDEGLQRFPVRLFSYCVLANHWHLVVAPVDVQALSCFMRWVSATHAIRWHHHRRTVGQGPVYQGRFFAAPIDDATQLIMTCRYVERNALSAGLVKRAQDWPWCSLAERLRSAPEVALVPAPFLLRSGWQDYVNAVITTRELLKRSTSVPKCGNPVENTPVPLT